MTESNLVRVNSFIKLLNFLGYSPIISEEVHYVHSEVDGILPIRYTIVTVCFADKVDQPSIPNDESAPRSVFPSSRTK